MKYFTLHWRAAAPSRRHNVTGIEGLRSRISPGRPPTPSEEQMEELRMMVLEGPDVCCGFDGIIHGKIDTTG